MKSKSGWLSVRMRTSPPSVSTPRKSMSRSMQAMRLWASRLRGNGVGKLRWITESSPAEKSSRTRMPVPGTTTTLGSPLSQTRWAA